MCLLFEIRHVMYLCWFRQSLIRGRRVASVASSNGLIIDVVKSSFLHFFFFPLWFFTFLRQCFPSLIPQVLAVLCQLFYFFLHFYPHDFLWLFPMYFLTDSFHNLSIFSEVWSKHTHSWIVWERDIESRTVEPLRRDLPSYSIY